MFDRFSVYESSRGYVPTARVFMRHVLSLYFWYTSCLTVDCKRQQGYPGGFQARGAVSYKEISFSVF